MDDIEMMDIEDSASQSTQYHHQLPHCPNTGVKRSLNVMNGSAKRLSPTLPALPQELRNVLKARRRVAPLKECPLDGNDSLNNRLVCVLDTNILVSHLNPLKQWIVCEEKRRQESYVKSVVIPWVVVQELDHLKTGRKHKGVVNVIHFINEQFNKTNGLVCGQNTQNKCKTHSKSREVKRIEEEVNDDKILNCCLDLSAFEDNVVLVTNDMNLCNKALMSGVNAINWNQLCHKYSINNDKRIGVEMDVNSSLKDQTIQSIDDNNSESKHKRSKSDANYSKSPVKQKSLRSGARSSLTPKSTPTNSSYRPNSCALERDDCPLKYDDWIRYRDECQIQLLAFVERIYKDIWDKDWQQMLDIDVNNASLKDIIRLIRKEWFANFSDRFNRDPSVKELIDRLHTNASKSDANYHIFYSHLKNFV
ncbi:unnamed protein product [Oppiella nova]|uniref:PIN domain-containing protein n=1 Tax=Oppiella nova TaxID=334625 RepID=A0A7R9MG58_9ACAR|nr:unnamed protein product [Oppiella nova]CAG2176417.1 unnamed protein product [Oppiella nova]